MKWSQATWKATEPVYNKIIQLPFVNDLIEGKLDQEKFIFYLQQDALYLAEYGKVLMGIASKLSKSEHIESFIRFAGDTMAVEKALHLSFLKEIDLNKIEPSPSCLLYTSYLYKHLANSPVELIVASVLPCFWVYQEVGNYILANQKQGENPYQSWIDTYGGEDFANSVKLAISICDELANNSTPYLQEQMKQAFVMCTKFEWMFWDSAYNMEKWKV